MFCLALIPIPNVDSERIQLQHLIKDIGLNSLDRFWQYFINTFFEVNSHQKCGIINHSIIAMNKQSSRRG
jgi:hypothetical protein